jgi:hypothetical protein
MPEMRAPTARSALPVMLVAWLVVVAACVPRPAGPRQSSAAGQGPGGSPSPTAEPGVTPSYGPVWPTPIPSFVRPTPLPAPTFLAYTVKSGDTLTSIARDYRTSPRSIAFWSRGEHPSLDPESASYEPDRLEVGWVLLLVPDTVFDEDQLMDATPSPTPADSAGESAGPSAGRAAGATAG